MVHGLFDSILTRTKNIGFDSRGRGGEGREESVVSTLVRHFDKLLIRYFVDTNGLRVHVLPVDTVS